MTISGPWGGTFSLPTRVKRVKKWKMNKVNPIKKA